MSDGSAVYVGNLAWGVTDAALAQFLQQGSGEMPMADVARYPDGRSKGWGTARFADPAGASSAIARCNGQELMGRMVAVREDRKKVSPESMLGLLLSTSDGAGGGGIRTKFPPEPLADEPTSGTHLYVGNLPWSTTSGELKDIFSEYNVASANVVTGNDGRSRGDGIISFEAEDDAAAALALGGCNVDGRTIIVRYDRQQPRRA